MKRFFHLVILIVALASFPSNAQKVSDIPGSFVDVGFGTRPVGLGFAFVGLADDENATYYNPAGLSQINAYNAGFSQGEQFGLIAYNYASATIPLPGNQHSLGITFISSGDDALEELSVHAAYGVKWNNVSLGVGLKYRNASFGNNTLNRDDFLVFDDAEIDEGIGQQVFGDANGLGLDLGFMVHATDRVQFGLLIRDAYAPMTWQSEARSLDYQARGEYEEELPTEIIIGSSFKLSDNFLAVVDFQPSTTKERTDFVRAGIEGRLVKVLMIRAGTEQGINDLDDERFTLGTGIDLKFGERLRLQSGFSYIIDPIQNSERISVTLSF